MGLEDLIEVLVRTNDKSTHPIDEKLLRDILTLVVSHPLDEDRAACQDKISFLISQYLGGKPRED